ncbi:DUF1295 domain-containing protein [bacterium]|nr:DUF1295 domain-containing protein [bacterium]
MTLLWAMASLIRDVSIVDPFWGTGFVIVAWVTLFRVEAPAFRVLIIAAMTTLWGLRLSGFLLIRNWGHPEDKRYSAMRAKHGPKFVRISLFTVFWLQALILWFVALPIQVAILRNVPQPITVFDAFGIAIWGIGLFFETAGDAQLARFKSRPENSGKVMDKGLWAWTRHPNYFGDFCVWWGIFIVAAMGAAGWTILSPLAMSWLLMKVSGVTLLEKTITDRRPDYADYKRRTSAFFPRPPKPRTPA